MRSARAAVTLATLVLAPRAAAVEVDVFYNLTVLGTSSLTLSGGGAAVAPGSVSLSLDPAALRSAVRQEGVGRAEEVVTAAGSLTNLLDAAVTGRLDVEGGTGFGLLFEGPEERATLFGGAVISIGDQTFETFGPGGGITTPFDAGCSDYPCYDFFDGSIGSYDFQFAIGPGQTLPVEVAVTTAVEGLAAIPLPAALGPLALALSGLAWAGRRRLGRLTRT